MPEKPNIETEVPEKARISYLKVFLVFGPHVAALITMILCIILFYKVSEVTKSTKENAEIIQGVIMQQSDLSDDVYELSQQVDMLKEQLEVISSDNEELKNEMLNQHPNLAVGRDQNEWPKVVYLTFDDGPSPNTARILDILKEYNVQATFFTVGKEASAYRELYNRIVDEGHTLGMHSYSHVYKDIYASKEAFTADYERISSYLEEITGVKPKYYRFPGGSNNKQIGSKFDSFAEVLKDNNVTYFDWNISTGDATNPPLSAEEITENALNGIEKHEEVIILMHDLGNKDTTVDALPSIIEALLDAGIPIRPITESTELIQYH